MNTELDDKLDELALIGQYWTKGRDEKRQTSILRELMITTARSVARLADAEPSKDTPK